MTAELQPKTDFKPAEEFVVEATSTLKVVADPLRLRILELMYKPRTVKQVAAELDMPPTKLYYHFNLLEKEGLIVLVDTKIVSGIIEKHYQVVAKRIRIEKQLLSADSPDFDESTALFGTIFEDVKSDLIDSIRAGVTQPDSEDEDQHKSSFNSSRFCLTEEQAQQFYKKLKAIEDEYADLSERQEELLEQENMQTYRYLGVFFPSSRRLEAPTSQKE